MEHYTADPIDNAKSSVHTALNDLISTGALQACNQMDIESLLNPAGKSQVMTETLDNEIYQAVMDSVEAHKDLEINGANDKDDNDPTESELCPTRHDLLKAVSTLSKFIEYLDDPATHKLEALLGPFVRGHPSVSLPPLSSPTLPLFICIPPPHLCTISKDHT
jgi:hypothetical protein